MESVGISVWWSDFSIFQAFCKETQPDNLLAKYLEQFHEAPAIIYCKKGQDVVDLASDARVQAFQRREKRDLLGLQTLD